MDPEEANPRKGIETLGKLYSIFNVLLQKREKGVNPRKGIETFTPLSRLVVVLLERKALILGRGLKLFPIR